MNKQAVFAGIAICTLGAGEATAGCGAPSSQVTDGGTVTIATVTFYDMTASGNNKGVTVAGVTDTRDGNSGTVTGAAFAGCYANRTAGTTFTNTSCGTTPATSLNGTLANWSSGSALGNQVNFTSSTAATIPLSATSNVTAPTATYQTQTGGALTSLLTGNTVCVGSAPTWENQEWHRSGGELWDWKLGNGHLSPSGTIDPTKLLGSWSITGTGASTQVNYTYTAFGGPSSHSFTVWKNTDADGAGLHTYSFCSGTNEEALGRIYQGEISCTAGGTRL